jgi:hypothetical protein
LFSSFSMSSVKGVGDFFLLFLLRFTSCTDRQTDRHTVLHQSVSQSCSLHAVCSAHYTLLIQPVMLWSDQSYHMWHRVHAYLHFAQTFYPHLQGGRLNRQTPMEGGSISA